MYISNTVTKHQISFPLPCNLSTYLREMLLNLNLNSDYIHLDYTDGIKKPRATLYNIINITIEKYSVPKCP